MGQKRIHLVVRGRVQGVYFRASTQREAKRLGLTGWVKNRPDGGVEIVAEGEEDQVKDLLSWAQHGPSTARVEGLDTRWRSYTGEFSDFRIVPEWSD
jgi:acylphosphatase